MAELKTKATRGSVAAFIGKIEDEGRRQDCQALVKMMKRATGEAPKMWGAGIVGFGSVHLKYESGRELDWFTIGFAPRKQDLTLYGLLGGESGTLLERLGKHSRGKGCLYIKRLHDVEEAILRRLIEKAARRVQG
jgi:hypothetical protein